MQGFSGSLFILHENTSFFKSASFRLPAFDRVNSTTILSKFEIKQRKTPDAKLDEKGNPIEIKEDSEAVKRLKATYEAKGITVGATA